MLAALIGATVLWVGGGLGAVIGVVMLCFADDLPANARSAHARLFWTVLTAPLVCLAAVLVGWGLYFAGSSPLICGVLLVPAVSVGLAGLFYRQLQAAYRAK